MTAHPRSRGENRGSESSDSSTFGSSPLTRGKPSIGSRIGQSNGLIPAHAGKTCRRRRRCIGRWAHPRSRGENEITMTTIILNGGSSPLTRGKRGPAVRPQQRRRLIPAHAGKTLRRQLAAQAIAAHPRSRGENLAFSVGKAPFHGSSPLTRGKPEVRVRRVEGRGLIPAHAGKTDTRRPGPRSRGAHPRSRGENGLESDAPPSPRGSSPLTRGKRDASQGAGDHAGLIPAHAGKTVHRQDGLHQRTAHPRSRGENVEVLVSGAAPRGSSPLTRGKPTGILRRPTGPRLIPAHAGKTPLRAAHIRRRRAHPRSRGENRLPTVLADWS